MALSAVSLVFCLSLLGLGEFYCRYFLDINLRKTSKEFVSLDADGHILGNAKNAKGVSFGADIYSDENGFRIPQGYVAKTNPSAVLFLGDSVIFGVGVSEEKTFVGLFRKKEPDLTVYNSGVPGYWIVDYTRITNTFLPAHPEIKRVYLFYCLNDFQVPPAANNAAPENQGVWKAIKRGITSMFVNLNEFLGPRSKLYVYITGKTADPSQRYFLWDLSLMNVDDKVFRETLSPIVDIDRVVKAHNAQLTVFINPYEMQVREGPNANFEPQQRIEEFLKANAVDFVDTRDRFKGLSSSKDAFLFADPMHLNEKGHGLVFDAVLENWQKANQQPQ